MSCGDEVLLVCGVLVALAMVGAAELDAAVLAGVALLLRVAYHVDAEVVLFLEGHIAKSAGVGLLLLVDLPVTLQNGGGGEALAALRTLARLLL